MRKAPQDHLLPLCGAYEGKEGLFFRFDASDQEYSTYFKKLTRRFHFQDFSEIEFALDTIRCQRPRFGWDVTGTLSVGAALAGEAECFRRLKTAKSNIIRVGINPSNGQSRPELDGIKANLYFALISIARRMGYIVEAEMAYGAWIGINSKYSTRQLHVRVMLDSDMPAHQLCGFGTNAAIDCTGNFQDRVADRIIPTQGLAYRTQANPLREIVQKEYDIVLDRLEPSDTRETLLAFAERNLIKLGVAEDDIPAITHAIQQGVAKL